jgi:hypothetical protein
MFPLPASFLPVVVSASKLCQITELEFLFHIKLNTEGANGTAQPIHLVILMLVALKQSLVLMCLHVNVTGITVVTLNYLVLLNTVHLT